MDSGLPFLHAAAANSAVEFHSQRHDQLQAAKMHGAALTAKPWFGALDIRSLCAGQSK